jgi:hypothetical protein
VAWWKKKGDEFAAATQERDQSKIGRMTWLRGRVEEASAFQSSDTSSSNPGRHPATATGVGRPSCPAERAGWGHPARSRRSVPALCPRHVDDADVSGPWRSLCSGGLVLHPQKTKLVYCKDTNRRGDFPIQSFNFLGYTFRPRKAMWCGGQYGVSSLPAASPGVRLAASEVFAMKDSSSLGAVRRTALLTVRKCLSNLIPLRCNVHGTVATLR